MMVSSGYILTKLCASLFLLLVISAPESTALTWTSTLQNGSTSTQCTGNDVAFNWNFDVKPEERVLTQEWHFRPKGRNDDILIATMVAGNFLTVPGLLQSQVTQLDKAGIHLQNVTSANSGVYSVYLNVVGPSEQTAMESVELDVIDGPRTASGYLNISLIPEPVFWNASGQYHAQLVCGHFITPGSPPVTLEWTTPGGDVHPSTFSTANNFTFAIPNPAESGNYTCRLNISLPSEKCAKAGTLLSESASRFLDGQEIRLQVMEYRLQQLEEQLAAERTKTEKLTAIVTSLQGLRPKLDHTQIPGKLKGLLLFSNTDVVSCVCY